MRVPLHGDNWAELRDPEHLTNGQRKPIVRAMARMRKAASPEMLNRIARLEQRDDEPAMKELEELNQRVFDAADIDDVLAVGEATATALVESWSYGPLPSEDPEALDNMPAADYDALIAAAGEFLPTIAGSPEPGSDPT